jgi:2-methylcitrate dehydratase PrpD
MNGLSGFYAEFILSTSYKELNSEVILQSKKLILDLMGVSLAGYKLMDFPRLIVSYMDSLGGNPEASIFQTTTKKKLPAVNAAFANAACAHALDMDDGHRFAALHPGTVVIPAAFAAAELSGATTKELIAGVVAGYEVMIRIGMAINPSSLNRGFHATGITGPFGAVAAAANIMKLGREEIIGALGLAGLQGSGLLQVNHDVEGAKVKPINPARAAMSGLLSCVLAQKGAKGPLNIFEGQDGFLQAVTDEVKKDLLTRDLGKKFEICNTYIKFYSACRHAHACIDAAMEAFHQSQIEITEIVKISVETYPAAIRLAGITDVTTPSSARFSIPFSVALALIKKGAGADKYSEENIRDENIRCLSRKVEFSVGKKWEKLYPNRRGASVRILDDKKRSFSSEVELAKGEPENPASSDEIYNKFHTNAALVLSEGKVHKLRDVILNLENYPIDQIGELI